MTKQTINLGTADKGNGDPLRTAFNKVNENFTELYTALGLDSGGLNIGSFEFTDNIITTTDSTNIIIDQAVVMTSELEVGGDIVPNVANQHTLGTLSKPFKSLYVSNNTIFIGGTPLAVNQSGELTINGSVVTGGNADTGGFSFTGTRIYNDQQLAFNIDNGDNTELSYTARLLVPENGDNVVPLALQNNNGSVMVSTGIDANNLQNWEFTRDGKLSVPSRSTVTFTAICDDTHVSGGGLTLSGAPWTFEVSFVPDRNGGVETQIDNDTPWPSNPGYTTGMIFNFSSDDHGIPGYEFQLTFIDIQNPSMFMYTVNLAANQSPEYPSTIESSGAVKISSGTKDWVLGSSGDIKLPSKWPIQFIAQFDQEHYAGPGTMMGDGSVSFTLQLQGSGATFAWAGDDPVYDTNRGYTSAQDFEFTEADHGITGYVLTINMILAGDDINGWSLDITLGADPTVADLAKIRNTDELMIRAGTKGWLFDTNGDIYLPAAGTIRNSAGTNLFFEGTLSTATGSDITLDSGDDIILQGKSFPGTDSEGGDINLYAGDSDPGNGGGDIAIIGGHAGQLDGPFDTGNFGGNITIGGGYGVGYTERGGNVTLQGGSGDYNNGGNILLAGGAGGPNGLKLSGAAVAIIENLNPVRVTFNTAHRLVSGDTVVFEGITTTTQLNNRMFYVSDLSDTVVDLFYDPDATIPVDGTGLTAYSTTVVTAINGNNESNNVFSEYTSNYPDLVNVIVGDLVSGVGIFGIKVVTSITEPTPGLILIHIDGTDGSVFVNTESYTFTRGGGGSAYSSAPGGSITVSAGQTFVDTYGVHGSINFNSGLQEWSFKQGGTTKFPTLTVPISDNANPSGTGQTLKFDDPSQQAIIYGPSSTAYFNSAERIIIQGAPGYTGTSGEGGDVYLWAGPGGSAGGDGGDIKIRAGRGQTSGGGGYLNFQAGDAGDGAGANGGWINIESGSSSNGTGGNITIDANSGGNIDLYTAASGVIRINTAGGNNVWTFDDLGNLTVPGNIKNTTTLGGEISVITASTQGDPAKSWTFKHDGQGVLAVPTGSAIKSENRLHITSHAAVFDNFSNIVDFDTNSSLDFTEINIVNPQASILDKIDPTSLNYAGGTGAKVRVIHGDNQVYETTLTGGFASNGTDPFTGLPRYTATVPYFNISGSLIKNLGIGTSATWQFSQDGILKLPGGGNINGADYDVEIAANDDGVSTYGHVTLKTNGPNGVNEFYMNSLGELNLPRGGVIQETQVTNELWGGTTTSMTLVPGGAANGTQRLEIYSTGGGEGDHIHIRSGDQNQTDLFLGNDTQYFAVAANGANYIQARNGTASPSPGISAGPGANVNIYAGSAGDNGGNVSDGNSGGDVFISSGISTSGLGGDILINTSSGPDGFGSIELSTDGGSSVWTFNKDNQLVFPDSTIQTTAWTGSITKSIQSVTVTTPTAITADVVFGDPNAAGGNVNLVLPASPVNGTVVTVKNINAGGNSVFVQTNGIDNMETEAGTIGSGVYATIAATGDFITWIYQSSTTTYRIIG